MRPPAHWHLKRRRDRRLWWALGAVAALVLIGVVALRVLPSAGGDATLNPSAVDSAECTVPLACPPATGSSPFGAEALPVSIVGQASAIIEAPCGTLLYGSNEHARLPPASLAKIATAIVAYERSDLDTVVDVRVNSGLLVASTGSTVMGLKPGVRMTMRDLMHGLLLVSGNDAAIAIAEAVAGRTSGFVALMNDKAVELGLRDTRFANPHGLDEEGLYTSAYDAALLGQALLNEPELASIVSTKSYQAAWDGPLLWNGNALLNLYPGALGVKIGYTERAGQTIVAAAERDGRRIIVSVLGSLDRYTDAIGLFEWAFANTEPACAS